MIKWSPTTLVKSKSLGNTAYSNCKIEENGPVYKNNCKKCTISNQMHYLINYSALIVLTRNSELEYNHAY